MKVNQEQIQDLFAFTRQHFVYHFDLQNELVDHLANDIETIWLKQPKLSYKEARDKAFKKFGVFGFMDVIEKRQKAMSKRYINYLWQEFKMWFTLPKLVVTLTIFIGFYTAFSSDFAAAVLVGAYSIITLWCFFRSIQLNRQFRRRKERSEKKWMLEEMIFKQAGGSALILISQLPTWYRISGHYFDSQGFVIVMAALTTLFTLWMFVSFEVLPNKAEKLLADTYPEFSL